MQKLTRATAPVAVELFLEDSHISDMDSFITTLSTIKTKGAKPDLNTIDDWEKRVSFQPDKASLKELMIPSFNQNCDTFLDVELVYRLLTSFVSCQEVFRTGGGLVKVGKLVDGYLALDSHLKFAEFVALASAVPNHGRCVD